MPIIIEMPSLSPTMEKGNLVSWLKNEGDTIDVGDVIAEIDTDKATMDFESIHKGRLVKILVPSGSHDVSVRSPIAVLASKNESDAEIENFLKNMNDKKESTEPQITPQKQEKATATTVETCIINKVKASPLAKRVANEYGIDISRIKGTGPFGRIVKNDVLNCRKDVCSHATPTFLNNDSQGYIDEEMPPMRRVIGQKLVMSKNQAPHFYMTASANVSEIVRIREEINSNGRMDTKILMDAFIVRAVALSLHKNRSINVCCLDSKIRKFQDIDVCVAVSVDGGLFTPVIKGADKKGIKDLSFEIRVLANQAREGKLTKEQYTGGSITISNLGMYNIDSFSSIINPPQGSILSIAKPKITPVFDADGVVVKGRIMSIGYACDHRVIDGKDAATFLEDMIFFLENPMLLLV